MPQAPAVVRKTLEAQYSGRCTITEWRPYKKPNKSTAHREVVVLEEQPCRLSMSSVTAGSADGMVVRKTQVAKLFLAPEIVVKPGSKITVVQNGKTTHYQRSGEAAVRSTHQELTLDLFEGFA